MVLAGPIVDLLGWRWLFWLPMAIVLVIGVFALRVIPESKLRAGGRINWLAAVLLAGWLVALLLPLTQGSQMGLEFADRPTSLEATGGHFFIGYFAGEPVACGGAFGRFWPPLSAARDGHAGRGEERPPNPLQKHDSLLKRCAPDGC